MDKLRTETVDTLNDLIRIVEDSHEGYRQAAESSEDEDLRTLFNDLAGQRGAIVRELQRLVAREGGAPDIGGTMLGGAHRFFLGLRTAVMGRDRNVILAEVGRGEEECLRRYEEALSRELADGVGPVIAEHLARIRSDCSRMAALRDAAA